MSSGLVSSEPHIVSTANEYRLNNPPTDGVSNLQFAPDGSKFLLVSSWDSQVRLYELAANSSSYMRMSYEHHGPVLDCCFMDNSTKCASGGLDNCVKIYDFNASNETKVGTHEKPVKCVAYCSDLNLLISGSWDSTVKIWDPRSPTRCVTCLNQPERVYTMAVCGDKLVVGTAGRKVWIWNLRALGAPEQKRDSSLKYQTRCIRAFPNKQGFVLSSIEGRVSVEYLDTDPDVQKKKYAFKCHRVKDENLGQEFIYPVNVVAFHPLHNTFATGGSDALVNIWDPFNKKRLCQFHKYPTSVSALSFSADGSQLAIASSYQYELPDSPNPLPEDTIFIRKVSDQETKPKS